MMPLLTTHTFGFYTSAEQSDVASSVGCRLPGRTQTGDANCAKPGVVCSVKPDRGASPRQKAKDSIIILLISILLKISLKQKEIMMPLLTTHTFGCDTSAEQSNVAYTEGSRLPCRHQTGDANCAQPGVVCSVKPDHGASPQQKAKDIMISF